MVLPLLAAIAPFAPLISGAISGLGSLLAPKPKPQTQTVSNSIDLARLRADAEANGFNPLGIIRAGGLAGYGTSTETLSAAPDMRLSNALSSFGSGFASWQYDPYGEAKSLAELALAKAQIKSYAATGAPSGLSLQTPKSSGTFSGPVSDYVLAGFNIKGDPNWSDAQVLEDRHGDIVSSVYGLLTLGADSMKAVGFKGDKLVSDLAAGTLDFARYLDKRKVSLSARQGADGVTIYTGGGF